MMGFHFYHLLLILHEHIKATNENGIETGLLWNNNSIRLTLNATLTKAVQDTKEGKEADLLICRVTSRSIES